MTSAAATHPYIGMWITADRRIRHELLANGRYVEARGTRERAYQGRYEVMGNHIEYWDDTGFTADGDFIDGVLHHAGMTLFASRSVPPYQDARHTKRSPVTANTNHDQRKGTRL
jgi:hypothetical protein